MHIIKPAIVTVALLLGGAAGAEAPVRAEPPAPAGEASSRIGELPSWAMEPFKLERADMPKLLQTLLDEPGVRYLTSFPQIGGLIGHAFQIEGDMRLFYSLADGETMLVGNIVNSDGEMVSNGDAAKYSYLLDQSVFWESKEPLAEEFQPVARRYLEQMATKSVGAGRPQVYVFYDGYCGYCKASWKTISGFKNGPVGIIPVAKITEKSDRIAAAMLASSNVADVLDKTTSNATMEALYTASEGLMSDASLTEKLAINNRAMDELGLSGTPSYIWMGSDGKVRVHSGGINANALAYLDKKAEATVVNANPSKAGKKSKK